MTKKDYVIIARALKYVRAVVDEQCTGPEAIEFVAQELALHLAADNSRFDRSRFLVATR